MNGEDMTTERRLQESERTSREVPGSGDNLKEPQSNEKPLAHDEKWMRLLYENAPLGFQCLDEIGHLMVVNQEWLSLTGYSREQVVGKWFGDYLVPSQKSTFREQMNSVRLHGQIRGAEYE